MNKLTVCFLSSVLFGCSTFNSGTEYKFPSSKKTQLKKELEDAKNCIQSLNQPLQEKAEFLKVMFVKGEKKFKEGWGWREPNLDGAWVLGITQEIKGKYYYITLATDPNGNYESKPSKHEFGHFWLLSNYKEGRHLNKYSGCFLNWNESNDKSAVRTTQIKFDDVIMVVDYIEDFSN